MIDWQRENKVKMPDLPEESIQKCRICGCTGYDACETAAGPCFWVETDLCSMCAIPQPPESSSLALSVKWIIRGLQTAVIIDDLLRRGDEKGALKFVKDLELDMSPKLVVELFKYLKK